MVRECPFWLEFQRATAFINFPYFLTNKHCHVGVCGSTADLTILQQVSKWLRNRQMKIKKPSSVLIERVLKNTAEVCGDNWLPDAALQTLLSPGTPARWWALPQGLFSQTMAWRTKQNVHMFLAEGILEFPAFTLALVRREEKGTAGSGLDWKVPPPSGRKIRSEEECYSTNTQWSYNPRAIFFLGTKSSRPQFLYGSVKYEILRPKFKLYTFLHHVNISIGTNGSGTWLSSGFIRKRTDCKRAGEMAPCPSSMFNGMADSEASRSSYSMDMITRL